MAKSDDVNTLARRLRREADDAANAIDAGMTDLGTAALTKVQEGLAQLERMAANGNGSGPAQSNVVPIVAGQMAKPQEQSLEAEESVLGAMMLAPAAVKAATRELTPDDFYRDSHRLIFSAIVEMDEQGVAVDAITVTDHLRARDQLEKVHAGVPGGPTGAGRVFELASLVPTTTNISHYTRIVRRCSVKRKLERAVALQPTDPGAIAEAAAELTREEMTGGPRRAVDAAEWLHTQPEGCPAVWGKGDKVLWAEGEPLMLYGPDGVGKTSVAQQVVLHLCGIRNDVLFGMPVARASAPVLYLACDRPRQARRSLYRMIPRENHDDLKGRLLVWEGPLPFAIPTNPKALLDFCQLHEAGYVIVDSLKDVAVDLTKPETALRVNQAFQWLSANGVELLILHHPRKDPAGQPAKPKELEDVYGDRNFTAGMGSVALIWGKAGDPIVELRHLKQPSGEVGPMKLLHDHDAGVTNPYEYVTISEILSNAHNPLSVPDVARIFFACADEPSKNEIEKARRELRKLVAQGVAQEFKDPESGALAFGTVG